MPVGLLATALLVVNNLRDIPGDTASGKRTLAVRLGDARTRWLYVGMLVAAFVVHPVVAGGFGRPAGRRRPRRRGPGPPAGARRCWRAPPGPPSSRCSGATGPSQLVSGALLAGGLWLSA